MSFRAVVSWLFEVGDGRRLDEPRRSAVLEPQPLYGEAEAIRVLYQTALADGRPPKPPRPSRGRPVWVSPSLVAASPVLGFPVGAKA
jgi:hypothetical protein